MAREKQGFLRRGREKGRKGMAERAVGEWGGANSAGEGKGPKGQISEGQMGKQIGMQT